MVTASQRAPNAAKPGVNSAIAPMISTSAVTIRNHWPKPMASKTSIIIGTPASLAAAAATNAAARVPWMTHAVMIRALPGWESEATCAMANSF